MSEAANTRTRRPLTDEEIADILALQAEFDAVGIDPFDEDTWQSPEDRDPHE